MKPGAHTHWPFVTWQCAVMYGAHTGHTVVQPSPQSPAWQPTEKQWHTQETLRADWLLSQPHNLPQHTKRDFPLCNQSWNGYDQILVWWLWPCSMTVAYFHCIGHCSADIQVCSCKRRCRLDSLGKWSCCTGKYLHSLVRTFHWRMLQSTQSKQSKVTCQKRE